MTRRWTVAILAVLVVALIGALAILILRGGDEATLKAGESQVLTASQLFEVAGDRSHPVYWLGEREGVEYEATETPDGRFYVRYLEGGKKAESASAEFLTVGTYPSQDGAKALRLAMANRKGAKLGRANDGAVLLIDPGSPDSAHLAYPGSNLQIEVYSPVPGQALRLAAKGAVQPVP